MKAVKIDHKIICDIGGCGKLADLALINLACVQLNLCKTCAKDILNALGKTVKGEENAKKQ